MTTLFACYSRAFTLVHVCALKACAIVVLWEKEITTFKDSVYHQLEDHCHCLPASVSWSSAL